MAELILVGRRSPGQRCAYCHGELGDEEVATCEGCQVTLHVACRAEVAACPTRGCGRRGPHPARGGRARQRRGRRRRERPRARAGLELPPSIQAALAPPAASRASAWIGPRTGPYLRLVASGVWNALLGALLLGLLVALLTHLPEAYHSLTTGRKPVAWPMAALYLLGGAALLSFGVWKTGTWLLQLPRVWSEVGHLLDRTDPARMRLTVRRERHGKNVRVWADLRPTGPPGARPPGTRRLTLRLAGLLPPWWLEGRSGQEVWVYGLPPPGPYLLEFEDGRLALVHPDE